MATQRIVQFAPAVLQVECWDADGNLADPSGVMTVAVAAADGTSVLPAGTATLHPDAGKFTVALTAAQTAALNRLTATWTAAGDGSVRTTFHEIIGRAYFSVAEALNLETALTVSKYPTGLILSTRAEVEEEFEGITDRAFVPRYKRIFASGRGEDNVVLPVFDIRTVRTLRTYKSPGGSTFTSFTAAQLAGVDFARGDNTNPANGLIRRTDLNVFDPGFSNLIVEVEYGMDSPPADLVRAMVHRLRIRLNQNVSGIPDRAVAMTAQNGATYKLDNADAYSTGVPEIDAVYSRYSARELDEGKMAPASRPMRINQSRYSMWHR